MKILYPFCNCPKGKKHSFYIQKRIFFLLLIFQLGNTVKAQQVTELVTDFAGYWKSDTLNNNTTYPNTSHNVLSFKYNNVRYSTGVNDATLTANSLTFTAGNFQAFPISTVGGTILSANSTFIALASNDDGIPVGFNTNPYPSLKIRDVLIDGLHGLDIGTGVTNVPAAALINFPVSSIATAAISDAEPDILVSQIASPSSNGDTLYFVNGSGTIVGNKIAINWLLYKQLGTWYLDLYSMPNGALCDTAKINGTSGTANQTRPISLVAFKLSEFGITSSNAASVTNFILKASGTSDPAFIAYNAGSFTIPAPVITVQPVSLIVCPGTSNTATFSVTATGSSLTYQWSKNNATISGATSSTYTITNVTAANTGSYSVLVSNSAGAVESNTAYLNVSIAVQPTPSSQNIATGASCTLSVSANNATSYQWKQGGVNISGATSATYTINPVTATSATSYTVQVINSSGSGCANVLSSAVTVTGKTTLYSKSSGNLNLPATWGVVSDGSGSSPVDFSRTEHTFIVKNNASTGGDLTIAGTLDVSGAVTTITTGTTLDAGNIIRSGTGSLAGSSTSNLTVRGTSNLYFKTGNNVLENFAVYSGTVTLLNSLSITAGSSAGTVTLNGGTLATGDSLTFKSDTSGTASLAVVSGGASITGKAIVERCISAHKAWRFLSIPTNTTQTIQQTWQEGATSTSSNPVAGYGIQITGAAGTSAGFDLYTATPSMKTYNSATAAWVGVPNTNTAGIKATNGYMVFIRGDRTAKAYNSTATQTTLRTRGTLYTGNQPAISVNAGKFASIGNPYASTLDMRNITKTGVKDFFYLWDPKLGGSYGYGAYQTFSNNGSGNYVITPGGGSYGINGSISNYIASGQAFFVQGDVGGGSLTFTEAAKTTGSGVISIAPTMPWPQFQANLYGVNADNSTYIADGLLINYDDSYSNSVDDMDAIKSTNTSENLSVKTAGTLLVVERRHTIISQDTVFLNLTGVSARKYRFEFMADQLYKPGLSAFLIDNYLHTTTPLYVDGTTDVNFSVTSVAASYAPNRFMIVFGQLGTLPVTFTSVTACPINNNINVEWKVDNEMNIKLYETEKSTDGNLFTSLAVTAATGNGGHSASYLVTDTHPVEGYNYYRIKSVDENGQTTYTHVVKVAVGSMKQDITVYPNPVTDGIIRLKLNDQPGGKYDIRLLDKSGQVIMTKQLLHNDGSSTETIPLDRYGPHGIYQLEVVKPGGNRIIMNVIY